MYDCKIEKPICLDIHLIPFHQICRFIFHIPGLGSEVMLWALNRTNPWRGTWLVDIKITTVNLGD